MLPKATGYRLAMPSISNKLIRVSYQRIPADKTVTEANITSSTIDINDLLTKSSVDSKAF